MADILIDIADAIMESKCLFLEKNIRYLKFARN